jgi:predicted ATPase
MSAHSASCSGFSAAVIEGNGSLEQFVVISGCSGGGKSTLLRALAKRGYGIVEEPGRRIVAEELERGGTALPWVDAPAFARLAIALSLADRAAVATAVGWVFFDRGLIDAAAAFQHVTHQPMLKELCWTHRYHRRVFLTPPWPQIYVTDHERQHGFSDAVAEYDRLREIYPSLGYDIHLVPKVSVEKRADFVIAVLDQS